MVHLMSDGAPINIPVLDELVLMNLPHCLMGGPGEAGALGNSF